MCWMKQWTLWCLVMTAGLAGLVLPHEATAADGLSLREHLGRSWRNELVFFPATPADEQAAMAGQALVDDTGRPVAYQLTTSPGESPKRIALLVDLDAHATRSYRFDANVKPATSDLKIEETPETIRLVNGRTGIAIARRPAGQDGPVQGVRLTSGSWTGSSRLVGDEIAASDVRVTANGPAYVEVVSELTLRQCGVWRLVFRLQADEPVVRVEESFDLASPVSWEFDLHGQGFSPDKLYYRFGMAVANQGRVGALHTWALDQRDNQPLFHWEPWLHWWVRMRQGTWFGLYNQAGSDLLALGACEPSRWIKPDQRGQDASVIVTQADAGPRATFRLAKGERAWIIAALDKDASLEPIREKEGAQAAPLPQRYLIKHGDFPLDLVKDYILHWPGDETGYPRLFIDAAGIKQLRAQKQLDLNDKQFRSLKRDQPLQPHEFTQAAYWYLATGDDTLHDKIIAAALAQTQYAVDRFLDQDSQVTMGFAPHHRREIMVALSLADLIWSSPKLTQQQRDQLKAHAAFLGYTVMRPDYWSPQRGFAANPNMTTMVANHQAIAGSIIPNHPQARRWVESALEECDHELHTWSDERGGWLEAPHYAMASYDHLLGMYLMAYNAGFAQTLYHEKMKLIGEMFARIATPPDPRLMGWRHHPPVGNTYFPEPSGQYALLAYLWREKDPQFSAQMRWMFQQQGRWLQPGVGGAWPSMQTVRMIFSSFDLPAKAPAYQSDWFPESAVVLRSHFPSERESQLYMIAGKLHAHYDYDSGSITYWGKGSPLVDDFGYYGRAPLAEHSLLDVPTVSPDAIMAVKTFDTTDQLDYVRGQRRLHTRQIAFVKDQDPLGMNYVVMRDSLEPKGQADATWRLWMDVASVDTHAQGALAKGKFGVDMDIHLALPRTPALKVESLTRQTWGLDDKGKYGRSSPHRFGLVVSVPKGSDTMAVLFPRLPGEAPAEVTSFEQGKAVRIRQGDTTDYVFMHQDAFECQVDGVRFKGTIGHARVRQGVTTLHLGEPGEMSAGSQRIERTPEVTPEQTP